MTELEKVTALMSPEQIRLHAKIIRVIESCQTHKQCEVACRFSLLAAKVSSHKFFALSLAMYCVGAKQALKRVGI